ncbi:hypothetical protein PHMEG_0005402 [Phytophthora megakarya]|uniref:Uncharacterized protein n=1 Tax=Phytophthora megakarya TaxID=4795 RepID=A0A225WRK4_9STRA|nr:hypothetical protein PHMEG_0005402 [Phytophthora megakarya]
MSTRHPWQIIASAMPPLQAANVLGSFKQHRVAKSDLAQCFVCMRPAPMLCRPNDFVACADVTSAEMCPWQAGVMTCQEEALFTIEEAYAHVTPAQTPRKPILTEPMKDVVRDWASQGLKPKRIWVALLQRFGLDETKAPPLSKVQ